MNGPSTGCMLLRCPEQGFKNQNHNNTAQMKPPKIIKDPKKNKALLGVGAVVGGTLLGHVINGKLSGVLGAGATIFGVMTGRSEVAFAGAGMLLAIPFDAASSGNTRIAATDEKITLKTSLDNGKARGKSFLSAFGNKFALSKLFAKKDADTLVLDSAEADPSGAVDGLYGDPSLVLLDSLETAFLDESRLYEAPGPNSDAGDLAYSSAEPTMNGQLNLNSI